MLLSWGCRARDSGNIIPSVPRNTHNCVMMVRAKGLPSERMIAGLSFRLYLAKRSRSPARHTRAVSNVNVPSAMTLCRCLVASTWSVTISFFSLMAAGEYSPKVESCRCALTSATSNALRGARAVVSSLCCAVVYSVNQQRRLMIVNLKKDHERYIASRPAALSPPMECPNSPVLTVL